MNILVEYPELEWISIWIRELNIFKNIEKWNEYLFKYSKIFKMERIFMWIFIWIFGNLQNIVEYSEVQIFLVFMNIHMNIHEGQIPRWGCRCAWRWQHTTTHRKSFPYPHAPAPAWLKWLYMTMLFDSLDYCNYCNYSVHCNYWNLLDYSDYRKQPIWIITIIWIPAIIWIIWTIHICHLTFFLT